MLYREAWVLVAAAYALLAFAYLWPTSWDDVSTGQLVAAWLAFGVRTLQFHLGLLLLLIVLIAALRRKWRLTLAAAAPMLFILVPVAFQFIPRSPPPPAPGTGLRVMSVNLLMVNREHGAIIDEIKAVDPDVLLIQEYTHAWHDALQRGIGAAYPHTATIARDEDDSFGIAIYSRLPFVGQVDEWVRLGRDLNITPQMRAVVSVAGRDVALYNIHLLPPRRLDFIAEHQLQFGGLLERLASEKIPYVVGGDFNFPETTSQHAALRRIGVRDAHDLAGYGRGATWPVNSVFRYAIPGLRFDHIYLAPQLTARRSLVGTGAGSDHRPVTADVAFAAPGAE